MTHATDSAGPWALAWRRFKQDRVALVSLCITAFFLLVMFASYAGLLARNWSAEVAPSYTAPTLQKVTPLANTHEQVGLPQTFTDPPVDISDIDPLTPHYQEWQQLTAQVAKAQAAQATHLFFGADKWGRDVLAKVIKGSEVSMTVGIVAALLSVMIGAVLGALAGYFGGVIDACMEWLYNVLTSLPSILLILAVAAVFSRGFMTIILILGLTGWTGVYRLLRAEYLQHRERTYVRAAEALGASHASRMFRHILPNVSHVLLVQFSMNVVGFIKAEVILSFLGLGVPVDMVSWGTMLAETQEELVIGKWWQLLAAGGSMAILVTAISLFADAVRDALDPKLNE